MPKRKQHADMADGRASLWHWLRQVQNDPETADAVDVAVAILHFYNRKRGWAWPLQTTLAETAHNSVRQVQRKLHKLHARGHLDVISGQGRSRANRLRPILKSTTPVAYYPPEKHVTGDALNSEKHATSVALSTGKHATHGGKARQNPLQKHATGGVQNHSSNHSTEPVARARESDASLDGDRSNVEDQTPVGEIVQFHRPVREEKQPEKPQPEQTQRDAVDMHSRDDKHRIALERRYGPGRVERAVEFLGTLQWPITVETVEDFCVALNRVHGAHYTREQIDAAFVRAAAKGSKPRPGQVFEWLMALVRAA